MTLTSTLVLLSLLAVYTVVFSYYVCRELGILKRQNTLDGINNHAFGDYVDNNLHTVHRRIDDLETNLVNVKAKGVVNSVAAKTVNTTRAVAKKASPAKKAAEKKAAARKK